jgi:hypothetical protein
MRTLRLLPLLLLTLTINCQGNVKTTALEPGSPKVGTTKDGVIFFMPHLVKLTYSFTTLTDNEGKVLGTAALNRCRPAVQKEEVSILPDFSRPMLLENNSPASFAKFGVTLSNGMLTSVNSEPTQTASDLLSSGATLLKAAIPGAAVLAPGSPTAVCNSEPRITGLAEVSIEPPPAP